MERLNGIASAVRHSQSITRQPHQRIVTQHITILKVAALPVQIGTRVPTMIDDGDRVAVAGMVQDGILQALAWRNLSTGAMGNGGLGASLVAMVFFLAASMLVLQWFSSPFFGSIPTLMVAALLGGGAWSGWKAVRIHQAVLSLDHDS
jgi:hypothetical protein